jgi:hypothetical protein
MHIQKKNRHFFDLEFIFKYPENQRLYLIAAAIAYMLVMVHCWSPLLGQNETVYLIKSKILAVDGFLGADGKGPWMHLHFLFNVLIMPLWWLTQDPVKVAMIARAIIWLPAVYSIARLARQLRVPPFFFICGFFVWLIKFQDLGAGEWIFSSIEQKVCGYACGFAALTDIMRNRLNRSAVFAGASVLFHILVGGWFLIGLGFAMLVDRKRFQFSQLIIFLLIAGLVASPVLISGYYYISAPPPSDNLAAATNLAAGTFDVDRLIVLFRSPHHLDPDTILSRRVVFSAIFMIVALFGCFYIDQRRRDATLLMLFTGFLASLWIIAFVVGKAQWYWLLKFYLFRVGDTVVPLLFWLCVPVWALGTLLRNGSSSLAQKLFALTVWTIAMCLVGFGFPRMVKIQVYDNISKWQRPIDSELHATYDWIRQHTKEYDVFLINPCYQRYSLNHGFKLYTDRPTVIDFKSAGHNKQIARWFEKLQATNGDMPFRFRGFKACYREINKNFPHLNLAQLHSIRERYRARYYFVDVERPLLKPMLVFSKGNYFIYDLAQIPSP